MQRCKNMASSMESVFNGKYEVLKEIGRGGMSVVYLAMDKHLNKQWAIKEIRKTGKDKKGTIYVQSLMTEANLMKRLDHPAIPRIVDIVENSEAIYVVMDYVEGESLDKVLEKFGPQPQDVVLDWAKQLADAVAPRVIVPMHYRHGDYGLRPVGEGGDFLRLYAPQEVHHLPGSDFELTAQMPCGVVVPSYLP